MANVIYPIDPPLAVKGLGVFVGSQKDGHAWQSALTPAAWLEELDSDGETQSGLRQAYAGMFTVPGGKVLSIRLGLRFDGAVPAMDERPVEQVDMTVPLAWNGVNRVMLWLAVAVADGRIVNLPLALLKGGRRNGVVSLPFALLDSAGKRAWAGFTGLSVTVTSARAILALPREVAAPKPKRAQATLNAVITPAPEGEATPEAEAKPEAEETTSVEATIANPV